LRALLSRTNNVHLYLEVPCIALHIATIYWQTY